jgi:hypothetical protein
MSYYQQQWHTSKNRAIAGAGKKSIFWVKKRSLDFLT